MKNLTMGNGESLVSNITDHDDAAYIAMKHAIEFCKLDQPWVHLVLAYFPDLTIRQMDKLVRGVYDFHVINGKLIIVP